MKNNEKQGSLGVLSKPHRSSEHRSGATQEPRSIPTPIGEGQERCAKRRVQSLHN